MAIGRQEIPVANVIGSVGRVGEFDGCFRPRTDYLQRVVRKIRDAKPDAPDDPILVYQVDHAYFVVDGHKRMSLAVEDGRAYIDAEVERFPSRFHIDGATTEDELRATELERRFRQVTGLDRAAPDARFALSDAHRYLDLAESVKAHSWDLSRDQGRLLPSAEAARHWYDFVYVPVLRIARETGVARVLTSCSDAELFLLLRGGAGLAEMDPGWEVPAWFVNQAPERLREAEPRGVPAAVARITGRAKSKPRVLPPGDVDSSGAPADDDAAAAGRTVVRRRRRTDDPPD